jgi:hypothetical protein
MAKTIFFTLLILFGALQTANAQQVNWQPPYRVPEYFDRSIAPYGGFTSMGRPDRTFVLILMSGTTNLGL